MSELYENKFIDLAYTYFSLKKIHFSNFKISCFVLLNTAATLIAPFPKRHRLVHNGGFQVQSTVL